MPTTAKSHSTTSPTLVSTRRDRAVALERIDPVAEEHLDAMPHVHVPVEGADFGTEDALVGQLQRIDDSHLEATLTRRGGELTADPAGADHGDAGALHEPRSEHIAVSERPEVVNALQSGARYLDPSWLGARRQQQPVVRQLLVVAERHARAVGSIAVTVVAVMSSISCSA